MFIAPDALVDSSLAALADDELDDVIALLAFNTVIDLVVSAGFGSAGTSFEGSVFTKLNALLARKQRFVDAGLTRSGSDAAAAHSLKRDIAALGALLDAMARLVAALCAAAQAAMRDAVAGDDAMPLLAAA